ncbi:MAG: ribosome maturation factor RimP [Pseudobdellovibrio sp.]
MSGHVDNINWIEQIQKVAHDIALAQGCELYDVEVVGAGKGRVLRVFIDKAEGGIGIEDCSNVSKGLNEFLDQNENLVPGDEYQLEVSSPGLDRHLRKLSHFTKVIGQKVFVQLSQNLGTLGAQDKSLVNTKKFEEVLAAVDGNLLIFQFKVETVKIPLEKVEKSKLIFEFKQNAPNKLAPKGHKKK